MKAELYNYNCWIDESNAEKLKEIIGGFLKTCDFEILGFMEHHFSPQGYTCIWLLGESHLAIHTYPEHQTAYVELTSCAKNKNEHFQELISQGFTVERNQ